MNYIHPLFWLTVIVVTYMPALVAVQAWTIAEITAVAVLGLAWHVVVALCRFAGALATVSWRRQSNLVASAARQWRACTKEPD